ncbi:hypothetical protein JMUB7547_28740 [Staphylococcus aureus]
MYKRQDFHDVRLTALMEVGPSVFFSPVSYTHLTLPTKLEV